MPAGLGGGGYLALVFETVMGTYLHPGTAGAIFIPIISENLDYTESHYYSQQIRQSTVESEAKPGYYSVGGDIVVEVDLNYLPYFLHCSRHSIAKSGVGPYTYTYTPSQAGAASTAASGNVPRTASLTVFRNGVGYGYGGCVVNTQQYRIENGVLMATLGILGLSEADPGAPGSPAWSTASLLGADAHSVYVDVAGTAPAFAAADTSFNGFTADVNYNGNPQNRINALRSASYISYGKTDATYNTELDFLSKTEYNNFKNLTKRALKLESLKGGATFAAATEAFALSFYNSVYDSYSTNLGAMGDLIMAQVTGRALGITGGNPFDIKVKSGVNIL